jgi:hypothetical protein
MRERTKKGETMKTTTMTMLSTLALVACASASEVVPLGNSQHMVTGNAHGNGMGGHSLIEATKKAGEYCAAQHKAVNVVKSSTDGNVVWSQEVSQVTFTCTE